ncbi:hypothetical protein TKK_0008514 [Trichogramma kaykai]
MYAFEHQQQQLRRIIGRMKEEREGNAESSTARWYEAVKELHQEMHKHYKDQEIDWMLVHNSGCTIDDTELPHHVTSRPDLERFIEGAFRAFLLALPALPTIVTVARSSIDEYCPEEDVDLIQDGVLRELESRIGHEVDVTKTYNEEVLG